MDQIFTQFNSEISIKSKLKVGETILRNEETLQSFVDFLDNNIISPSEDVLSNIKYYSLSFGVIKIDEFELGEIVLN